MSIPLEEQLTTILTPIFGDEIYPIAHPDPDGTLGSVANLYGIFSVIGGQSFNKLDGDTGVARVRVQISTYSIDYTEFKATQKAINAAMIAANKLASDCVDTEADVYETVGALANVSTTIPHENKEPDTKRFYAHNEFYCWTLI